MFIAAMHTEHFFWVALGNTEDEVKESIVRKWNERREMLVEMPRATFDWLQRQYGVGIYELAPGECRYD